MNDSARRNDRELFESVASGDSQAYAELAGRHARGLYDFALRGTQDEQQSAAVLETVFRRIQDPATAVPSQIDFRTWLYSLCLVEVLEVANETRTARISTDDERFFYRTTDVDMEVAHWAWQAARGLRTRDYCVLDLTLRRGLTPEEVAEAASLTRSNLYASIGRARGAFEETFAAVLLFEHGRDACDELDEMVEGAPGTGLRPALRHQIIEHSDDCVACRDTLDSMQPAASVYVSLADVEIPEAVVRRILQAAPGQPVEPSPFVPAPVVDMPEPPVSATETQPIAPDAATEPPELEMVEIDEGEPERPEPDWPEWEDEEDAAEPEAEQPGPGMEVVPEAALALPSRPFAFPPGATSEDEVAASDDYETGELEPQPVEQEPLAAFVPEPGSGLSRDANEEEEVDDDDEEAEHRPGRRQRIATWVGGLRHQPMLWTYALLGIGAVLAVYLGIAVASSLQGGGGDSGAVPLDTQPGVTTDRVIDCGDTAIEMNGGDSTLVTFAENELNGYVIQTLSFAPVSNFAEFEDIEATLEGPFAIRFVAKQQDTAEPRTEEFELRIRWERDGQVASSACQLLVHLTPPTPP